MSIQSNLGELTIKGDLDDILAELSMIILGLRKTGIPKSHIDIAIETGHKKYKEENKKDSDKDFKKLLRNLGLED